MNWYWIYDGRYRADPDAATVLACESSKREAIRSARDFGDAVAVRMRKIGKDGVSDVLEDDVVVFDTQGPTP